MEDFQDETQPEVDPEQPAAHVETPSWLSSLPATKAPFEVSNPFETLATSTGSATTGPPVASTNSAGYSNPFQPTSNPAATTNRTSTYPNPFSTVSSANGDSNLLAEPATLPVMQSQAYSNPFEENQRGQAPAATTTSYPNPFGQPASTSKTPQAKSEQRENSGTSPYENPFQPHYVPDITTNSSAYFNPFDAASPKDESNLLAEPETTTPQRTDPFQPQATVPSNSSNYPNPFGAAKNISNDNPSFVEPITTRTELLGSQPSDSPSQPQAYPNLLDEASPNNDTEPPPENNNTEIPWYGLHQALSQTTEANEEAYSCPSSLPPPNTSTALLDGRHSYEDEVHDETLLVEEDYPTLSEQLLSFSDDPNPTGTRSSSTDANIAGEDPAKEQLHADYLLALSLSEPDPNPSANNTNAYEHNPFIPESNRSTSSANNPIPPRPDHFATQSHHNNNNSTDTETTPTTPENERPNNVSCSKARVGCLVVGVLLIAGAAGFVVYLNFFKDKDNDKTSPPTTSPTLSLGPTSAPSIQPLSSVLSLRPTSASPAPTVVNTPANNPDSNIFQREPTSNPITSSADPNNDTTIVDSNDNTTIANATTLPQDADNSVNTTNITSSVYLDDDNNTTANATPMPQNEGNPANTTDTSIGSGNDANETALLSNTGNQANATSTGQPPPQTPVASANSTSTLPNSTDAAANSSLLVISAYSTTGAVPAT